MLAKSICLGVQHRQLYYLPCHKQYSRHIHNYADYANGWLCGIQVNGPIQVFVQYTIITTYYYQVFIIRKHPVYQAWGHIHFKYTNANFYTCTKLNMQKLNMMTCNLQLLICNYNIFFTLPSHSTIVRQQKSPWGHTTLSLHLEPAGHPPLSIEHDCSQYGAGGVPGSTSRHTLQDDPLGHVTPVQAAMKRNLNSNNAINVAKQ